MSETVSDEVADKVRVNLRISPQAYDRLLQLAGGPRMLGDAVDFLITDYEGPMQGGTVSPQAASKGLQLKHVEGSQVYKSTLPVAFIKI